MGNEFPRKHRAVYMKMIAFGYGQPDCAVSNYWLKTHPVAPNNQQIKTLLLKARTITGLWIYLFTALCGAGRRRRSPRPA